MQVYGINNTISQYNPNFEAIHIRQINPDYVSLQKKIVKELDRFVKKNDNVELLGKGLTSSVYKFKKLQEIVFKKSLNHSNSFETEIKNLKLIPKSIKNAQKFVAQAFDDETGIFYLLSTKVSGKEADWQKNPWTKKGLRSLFSTMYEMDINGIYHGDLHCGNILLDKNGKTGFIDFQWTQNIIKKKFFEDNPNSFMPPFLMNENAQMFEMASVPYYLKISPSAEKGKEFLKNYLNEKSKYHQKRSDYLRQIIKNWPYEYENETILKGINFEDAQSILFRNPDEDILKIEIKKLQFLSSFRETSGKIDSNKTERDFVTATSSQLMTLSAIKELQKEIALQKTKKYISDAKKTYLNITNDYANYWFNSIKSWIDVIYDGSIKSAENSGQFPIKKYKPESITNLFDFVDDTYKADYTRELGTNSIEANKIDLKNIEKHTKNFKELSYKSIFDSKIMNKFNEISQINLKLQAALYKDWGLDLINLSILNLSKNRELKSLIQKKNISQKLKDDLITELHYSKELYKSFAQRNYKHILKIICSDNSVQLSGYKGMYNFE